MRPTALFASLPVLALAAMALAAPLSAAGATDIALEKAIHEENRSANFKLRDAARHPFEELSFFGLRPDATVVEIWPGGGYWTEILAPYLHFHGTLYAALPAGPDEEKGAQKLRELFAARPATFGHIKQTVLAKDHYDIAPPGSADFVLTFRNVHNWMGGGYADQAFAAFFRALKPGGILGIEEHRGLDSKPQDPKADDGYVRQDYTIALAKAAGFELVGSSEINANPRDTKNYPQGVWTLPPVLALGDKDRPKYLAIGEADNFVLKFRKPIQ